MKINIINEGLKYCSNCPSTSPYYDKAANYCVSVCSANYEIDESNKTCINCFETTNTQFFDTETNTCVSACPESSFPDSSNVCIKTADILSTGKYLHNEKIVDICPDLYSPNKDNHCKLCKYLNKVIKHGKCTDTCGSFYILDKNTNECIGCYTFLEVTAQETKCVETCNISEIVEEKYCIPCGTGDFVNKSFIESNKCVDKCSIGKDVINKESKECKPCKEISKFILVEHCVESCPENYILKESTKTCVFKEIKTKIIDEAGEMMKCEDYCINEISCSILPNKDYKCVCKENYYGGKCDIDSNELESIKEQIKNKIVAFSKLENAQEPFSMDEQSEIINIVMLAKQVPEIHSSELTAQITSIAQKKLDLINQGKIMPYENVLEIVDAALSLQSIEISDKDNSSMKSSTLSDKQKEEITKLKNSANTFVNNLLENGLDLANKERASFIFSSDNMKVHISDSSQMARDEIRKHGFSIVEYTECEKILQKNGILGKEEKLYSRVIEYDAKLNTSTLDNSSSNEVQPKFVNSKGKILDVSSCKSIQIKQRIKNTTYNDKEFKKLKEELNVDIFNREDMFFNDICISYVDDTNQTDVTLSSRREKFSQTSTCSNDCKYQGIDEHGYSLCECATNATNVFNKFKDTKFNSLVSSNISIVKCVNNAFTPDILVSNPGFWSGIILGCCSAIGALVYNLVIFKMLFNKANLSKVLETDLLSINNTSNSSNNNPPLETIRLPINNIGMPKRKKENEEIIELENHKKINNKKLPIVLINNEIQDNHDNYDNFSSKKYIPKNYNNHNMHKEDNNKFKNNYIDVNDRNFHHDNMLIGFKRHPKTLSNKIIKNNDYKKEYDSENHNGIINSNTNNIALNNHNNTNNTNNNSHKKLTKKDLDNLPFKEQLKHDKRSTPRFIWEGLKSNHFVLNLFCSRSLINPFYIRFFRLMFSLSINLSFSAVFYSDQYIEKRAKHTTLESRPGILYMLIHEFVKSLLAAIAAIVIVTILGWILIIPTSFFAQFNKALNTKDPEKILKGYKTYKKKMCWRYTLYLVLLLLIFLLSTYYAMCFCSVYLKSRSSWLYGGLLSIVIDIFGFRILFPAIKGLVRGLARKHQNKCTLTFYYISKIVDIFF